MAALFRDQKRTMIMKMIRKHMGISPHLGCQSTVILGKEN